MTTHTLLVQDFLRAGGTPDNLKAEFGINYRAHSEYPELIQFKYDQIESPHGHPLVNECRGLILNSADNWAIVAYPFSRFFNEGETVAAKIDWDTATCYEKVDGSLCILYRYADKWHVATSGTPDACGQVNGFNFTFKELFWKTLAEQLQTEAPGFTVETFLSTLGPRVTYMFELCTPYNRVVVPHTDSKLWLLGGRVNSGHTWTQLAPRDMKVGVWVKPVPEFEFNNVADLVESFGKIDPLRHEGYVVCDAHFNRVKVKHPGYLALHKMRDNVGPKAFLEIIRTGESQEFLVYYPEYTNDFKALETKYHALVANLIDTWGKLLGRIAIGNLPTRKDQALFITKSTKVPGCIFSLLDKKVDTVAHYLRDIPIDRLIDYLKEY